MLIHNPIFTGSISLNGADISKISTVSSDSSSFASRITNTESTASAYVLASGSLSTRVTLAEATASALVTASGSFSARIASNEAKTGSFVTTGSNQFNGNQTVTGSLTATGTIVAQTLVVQTITSSVEFVTGSNRFGTTTGNTHEFTGSLLVSGSNIINGNVGIGTTSPGNKLSVANTAGLPSNSTLSEAVILVQDSGTNRRLGIGASTSGQWIQSSYPGTDGISSVLLLNPSGGNIGIGTTSPSYQLDVVKNTNAADPLINVSNPNSGVYSRAIYRFFSDTAGGQIGVVSSTWTADPVIAANETYVYGNRGLILYTTSTYPMRFITADTERMRITSGGNLGVGMTDPQQKIQTGGRIRVSPDNTNGGDLGVNDGGLALSTIGASPIQFWTSNYSNERMRITGAGLVSIGNSTPQSNGSSAVLDVGNGSGGTLNLRDTNTGIASEGFHQIYGGDNRMYLYAGGSGASAYMQFYTNDSERIRITSGGAVGIGTSVPTTTLDVAGSGKFRSGYMIYGGSSYTSYTSNGLWGSTATPNFAGTNGQGGTYNKFSGVNGGLILGYQDNGNGLYSPAYGFEVKSTDGRPVAGIVVKALVMKDVDTNGEPMVIYNNGSSYWENSMEVAKTSGTYAQLRITSDATYASVVRDYILTTSSNLDIATERTDGGAFNFLLLVSSTLTASASHRNYYTFAVQGRGTTATATQLSNVSAGTASRSAISVSFPSNGTIRLNLTGGESCQIKVTAIGHGAL